MSRMMRLSPEQYDAMLERQKAHAPKPVPAPPKPTKYRSRSCGGYQSVKEARRAAELRLKEKAGYIRNLRDGLTPGGQVSFELIPAQEGERSCRYFADFVYQTADGKTVVEDCKGYKKGAAYALFTIKRKLMLQVHGIRIREI